MKNGFVYKKILALVLILTILAPGAFLAVPHRASAQALDIIGGPSNILSAGFNAISAISDVITSMGIQALVIKEYVLDPLVPMLREIIIKSITASIVNWINGGFQGSPSFITNLDLFLLDIADQVAGRFIEGSDLAFLCRPFQLKVRLAIALDYYAPVKKKVACTLTGAIKNVQDAFGNFSNGSAWNNWLEVSINPNNNALWAYSESQSTLLEEIERRQNQKLTTLDWGSGFQSQEVCSDSGGGAGGATISAQVGNTVYGCTISTPGATIVDTLDETLGTGLRQLEIADELNEIIGALLAQLGKQLLGGSSGGLSGLSKGSGGRSSYVDQLTQESRDFSSLRDKMLETIRGNMQDENRYRIAKQDSLNATLTARGKVEALRQCYLEKAALNQTLYYHTETSVTSFTPTELLSRAASASSTVQALLLPIQIRVTGDITTVDNLTGQLVAIRSRVETAPTVGLLNTAVNDYQILLQSGRLHTIKGVFDAELERDGYPGENHSFARGIIRDMTTLNAQTDRDAEQCRVLTISSQLL
ncbi:hypothetical protein A3D62_02905 [Candidatus Kaiserbacteria bacterium RIFCSPHIGHO2_02_FULL_49_11]|uniref:Uncharacterized protein n=1 Tax=Candidatus Kaiserbacteria bacterium RIFCSPHIGHO2_02_FULL_49_11 TaxID=1798489 RepID=A0A1F6D0X5_9BACT|nr:MAG: hypothetical protein A3D62_02905 [Candidatus Kaiserbacteria bacterium RIFCSPHIGHO2_02_FULL_49_11]